MPVPGPGWVPGIRQGAFQQLLATGPPAFLETVPPGEALGQPLGRVSQPTKYSPATDLQLDSTYMSTAREQPIG